MFPKILALVILLVTTSASADEDCKETSGKLVCDSYRDRFGNVAREKWDNIGFSISIPYVRTNYSSFPQNVGRTDGRSINLGGAVPYLEVEPFVRPWIRMNRDGDAFWRNWLRSVEVSFSFAKLSSASTDNGSLPRERHISINRVMQSDSVITFTGTLPVLIGERFSLRIGPSVYIVRTFQAELVSQSSGKPFEWPAARGPNLKLAGGTAAFEYKLRRHIGLHFSHQGGWGFGAAPSVRLWTTKGGLKFSW